MVWVRWHSGTDWSIWHRATTGEPGIFEARVLGVTVPRISVREFLAEARLTSCGIVLRSGVVIQERHWLELPDGPRCSACLRGFVSPPLPPQGSPGGGPGRERSWKVSLASRTRRRPLHIGRPWL